MVNSRTFILPIPTNSERIGITVTLMVVMLMTITPVGHVANQVLCTTPTHAAPTSWVDQSPKTSAQCLLPSWWHGLAKTNPSHTVWRNATGQRHLPPAYVHGHAGVSAGPRNDDECWTVPSRHQKYANYADGPTANRGTHVDEPLCPQPEAQPDAGAFLTSRGG